MMPGADRGSSESWEFAHETAAVRRAIRIVAAAMGGIEIRLYPGESSYTPEQISAEARAWIEDYSIDGLTDYLMIEYSRGYTAEYAVIYTDAPDLGYGIGRQLPPGDYIVTPDDDPFHPYTWTPSDAIVTVEADQTASVSFYLKSPT